MDVGNNEGGRCDEMERWVARLRGEADPACILALVAEMPAAARREVDNHLGAQLVRPLITSGPGSQDFFYRGFMKALGNAPVGVRENFRQPRAGDSAISVWIRETVLRLTDDRLWSPSDVDYLATMDPAERRYRERSLVQMADLYPVNPTAEVFLLVEILAVQLYSSLLGADGAHAAVARTGLRASAVDRQRIEEVGKLLRKTGRARKMAVDSTQAQH